MTLCVATVQGQTKTVTFIDCVRNEPYGIMINCYDSDGNDIMFETIDRMMPLLSDSGTIKLNNTEKIKMITVKGDYYKTDSIETDRGVPDTIRIDHGDWPMHKFLGYFAADRQAESGVTQGFMITSTTDKYTVLVAIAGYENGQRKVWMNPVEATLDSLGRLTFSCNGVILTLKAEGIDTLYLDTTGGQSSQNMEKAVPGYALRPNKYKRTGRSLPAE